MVRRHLRRERTSRPQSCVQEIEDLAGGDFSPEQTPARDRESSRPDNLTLQPEIDPRTAPAREPVTLPEAIRKAKADAVAANWVYLLLNQTPDVKSPPCYRRRHHSSACCCLSRSGSRVECDEARARYFVSRAKGTTEADILTDVQTQMRAQRALRPPPPRKPQARSAGRNLGFSVRPINPLPMP